MARIWGVVRVREKIASDHVLTLEGPDLDAALDGLCRALDIPRPVVLRKHRNEFLKFRRTRFTPADFIEPVGFAAFEVEELRDRKKTERADT